MLKGSANVSLKGYSPEEIKEASMVEIAFELMKEKKQPFTYGDLVKQVAEIKAMPQEEVMERISYLYTDLNIDGRFISLGENRWGLRSWYPFEQADEEVTQTVRRKKAKKEIEDEDDFIEDEDDLVDEYEDLEDELDELANDEDSEEDDDEDEDIEEDLDEFDDTDDKEDLDEDLDSDDEDLL